MGLFKSFLKITPIGMVISAKDESKKARRQAEAYRAELGRVSEQRSLLEKAQADISTEVRKKTKRRTASPFSRSLLSRNESSAEMQEMKQTLGA